MLALSFCSVKSYGVLLNYQITSCIAYLSQGCGRLEFIEALKLRDWAEVCSQSQDTRSAVIGGAQNS